MDLGERIKALLNSDQIGISDTTLRDAHQSLWATRMPNDMALGAFPVIDDIGFFSLEVWGGATFDTALRFLGEDPWENLDRLKSKAINTPLQMLLRGQHGVGYSKIPNDVLFSFNARCNSRQQIFSPMIVFINFLIRKSCGSIGTAAG